MESIDGSHLLIWINVESNLFECFAYYVKSVILLCHYSNTSDRSMFIYVQDHSENILFQQTKWEKDVQDDLVFIRFFDSWIVLIVI